MPAGRPSSMTPIVREKVLEAICRGNYREVAARIAGISYPTLKRYLRKTDDPEAVELKAKIEMAEARIESRLAWGIYVLATRGPKAWKGDLRAAIWYLTHKFPGRWAEKADELKKAVKLLQEMAGAMPRQTRRQSG